MSVARGAGPASDRAERTPGRFRPRSARSCARIGRVPILAVVCWLCGAHPIRAQADRVGAGAAGLAAGAVAGVWTTTAIYVAKARTGSYLFSANDIVRLRWETIPVATFPVAGAIVGATSPSTLGDIAVWGGLGFLAGAGAGLLTGHLVRGTSEARWAGGIIGSGVGLLTGIVLGALRSDDESEPLPSMGVSIPLRIGGLS